MKCEIKVYKNESSEIKAVIKHSWFKYRIDPRHLKYKNVYLRYVDGRFDCPYWFNESDLGRLFDIDVSIITLKNITTTIVGVIEDVKNKIDANIVHGKNNTEYEKEEYSANFTI